GVFTAYKKGGRSPRSLSRGRLSLWRYSWPGYLSRTGGFCLMSGTRTVVTHSIDAGRGSISVPGGRRTVLGDLAQHDRPLRAGRHGNVRGPAMSRLIREHGERDGFLSIHVEPDFRRFHDGDGVHRLAQHPHQRRI